MKHRLIVKLLSVGKQPTGRTYSREILEAACEAANKRPTCIGGIGQPRGPNIILAEASHIASNFQLVGDDVMCTVHVMSTPCGTTLKRLMETNKVEFKAWGIGQVDDAGRVSDYQLFGCFADIK